MKNLKNIFTLLVVLATASIAANAQTANITASAEVLATITVVADQTLDFGNFLDGTTSTQRCV